MIKSNLIEAIRTLSPQEIKELGEFVSSPFFNKNKNVIKLFEIIRKYYPELESDKLLKENVYTKMFPGEQYKDSSIRLLMFYLYEIVEKFLAYSRYTRNELDYKTNLLAEFNERNLLKDFEKNYTDVKKHLDSSVIRDESFYLDSFFIGEEYFNFLTKIHPGKYDKFMTNEYMQSMFNDVTYFYMIRVLKFYAAILNTQYVLKHEIKTLPFENIVNNFNPDHFENIPLLDIYYRIIMMLLKPEEENHYFTLKELVQKHEKTLGNSGLNDIYINLENYCTRKIRNGDADFIKESLDVYKLELDKKIYLTYNEMPVAFYRNVVSIGCRLKEYDWLKDFIEKYKTEIREDSRNSLYNYSMAMLEADLKNYETALVFLSKVKTDDLYIKMEVRMLQCRIYYDLDWDDSLNSLIDAFKRTLANNKLLPEDRKIYFSNFLKYLSKLNNIRHKADELELDIFRKQMDKEDNFNYKAWLYGKIDELENVFKGLIAVN